MKILIPLKRALRGFLRRFLGINIVTVPRCLPPQLGEDCQIHESVEFSGFIENIKVGRNVRIEKNVVIRCEDKNSSVTIGNDTVLMPFSVVLSNVGGHISIGNHCSVNSFCTLYGGYGKTIIGNHVRIATHTVIVPTNHNFDDIETPVTYQGHSSRGIIIEDDVWIGAGVKVLDGVHIGKGSVIGASAVLNRSIEPFSVAVGIPARVIGKRGLKA